ncbi:MBOAT family O-acyltransferase [Singulisphaera sp. PoT]|uniref:MBOAT family O-acyltransferase n=1 Tax=Singulisphaera sp. PoT TaxID=3411797 RepID=UPI003BF53976
MLFCSQAFLIFFAVVFAAYWASPSNRLRSGILLCASFTFYASWNKWLALVVGVSTALDYALALGMERSPSDRRRIAFLAVSLSANLGLLTYFKYANFFLDSLEGLLHSMGVHAGMPTLKVIIPIGISFYTFEAISYTIDVYRRRIRAERNLLHFLLFITFFPHLVAGPIVRARDFLPQIARPKRWDWARMHLGVQYFLIGLFKKLAIADRMAAFSDPVFAQPESYGSYAAWVATLAYAIQIYCDFSGYTDMAIGCAHMLGYKLSPNFNLPYCARNVSEFWRRWHISLSTWLRDYLFIPLGGSRQGAWRTSLNLMITMTLGGLWHGASWTMIVWGVLHGALLVAHRCLRAALARATGLDNLLRSQGGTLVRILVTFACVCVGWVFFRATSFAAALAMLSRLAIPHDGLGLPVSTVSFWATLFLGASCQFLSDRGLWTRLVARLPEPVLGFTYATAFSLALILATEASQPFVYFQF